MSCDTDSRSVAAGPAGGSGISALANKAVHFAGKATGVAGGVVAGAIVGGGLGTLAGPVVGAVAGGVAGAVLGNKRYEKRQTALEEKQWRESAVGKKVLAQFDQTTRKLKLDYKEQSDRFKAQKESIEDELEQTKVSWLAEKLPEKDVRKKAMAGSLAAGGVMMATEFLASSGKVTGAGAVWSALASVAVYPEQVERLKNAEWKKSPEGKKAEARYIKRMDNLKTRWRRASETYKAQKAAAEVKYETAKARALAN